MNVSMEVVRAWEVFCKVRFFRKMNSIAIVAATIIITVTIVATPITVEDYVACLNKTLNY